MAMYYGIFGATAVHQRYRQALHFTVGLIIVSFLVDILATVLWCEPIHNNWYVPLVFSNPSGRKSQMRIYRSLGAKSCSAAFHYQRSTILYATNIVTDILSKQPEFSCVHHSSSPSRLAFVLPIGIFRSLNIRRREKVALIGVWCRLVYHYCVNSGRPARILAVNLAMFSRKADATPSYTTLSRTHRISLRKLRNSRYGLQSNAQLPWWHSACQHSAIGFHR